MEPSRNRTYALEQHAILLAVQPLLTAISNIALAQGWLGTSLLTLRLQSALVQAVPDGASPLAQLPGVSLDKAEELQYTKAAEGKRWIERFSKADVASDSDLTEAKKVAEHWPRFEIVDAHFKGESNMQDSNGKGLTSQLRAKRWFRHHLLSISISASDIFIPHWLLSSVYRPSWQ